MAKVFNPHWEWFGIDNREPDHYELLGLRPFEDEAELISAAAHERMARLKVLESGPHSALSQQLLNEVARAKVDLLNPERKKKYDAELTKKSQQSEHVAAKTISKESDLDEGVTTVATTYGCEETGQVLIVADTSPKITDTVTRSRSGLSSRTHAMMTIVCLALVGVPSIWFMLMNRPVDENKPHANHLAIDPIDDQVLIENQTCDIPLTVEVPVDADPWSIRLVSEKGHVFGNRQTGYRFRWTPSEMDGDSKVDVELHAAWKDSGQVASKTRFRIHVKEKHQAPSVEKIGDQITLPGRNLTIPVTATDQDFPQGELSYRLVGRDKAGARFAGANIVFDPPRIGSYKLEFEVSKKESPDFKQPGEVNVHVKDLRPGIEANYVFANGETETKMVEGFPDRTPYVRATYKAILLVSKTTRYEFSAYGPGSLQFAINGQVVIDKQNPSASQTVEKELDKRLHEVTIEHRRIQPSDPPIHLYYKDANSDSRSYLSSPILHHDNPSLAAAEGKRNGLLATYSQGTDKLTRVDPQVDFLWGTTAPDPLISPGRFKVDWEGWIVPPTPGEYEILGHSAYLLDLKIDGERIRFAQAANRAVSRTRVRPARSKTIYFDRAKKIEMTYIQRRDSAFVSLRWRTPGTKEFVPVPSHCLFTRQEIQHQDQIQPAKAGQPERSDGGLLARIYTGNHFNHLVAERIHSRLDWLWGNRPPFDEFPDIGADRFSIRWHGKLKVPGEGYRLVVVSDDGVKVWLGDQLAINEWQTGRTGRFETDLSEGEIPINIEYCQNQGNALFSLRWIPPGKNEEVIPSSALEISNKLTENDLLAGEQVGLQFETLIDTGQTWKYLDDGTDQGIDWRGPGFDDSKWKSGRSPLGYEYSTTDKWFQPKTKVDFGTDDQNRHPTTYFRTEFNLRNPESITRLDVDLLRDDAAAVYLNGAEIFRDKTLTRNANFKEITSDNGVKAMGRTNERLFLSIQVDPHRLVVGPNLLAIELHQHRRNSSDLTFDLRLVAGTPIDLAKSTKNLTAFFDGDSSIQTNCEFDAQTPITIEAFVLPLAHSQDLREVQPTDEPPRNADLHRQVILGNQLRGTGLALVIENRRWQFEWQPASGPMIELRSKTPPIADKWTHVSCAWDKSELRLYVDGVLQARMPMPTHKASRLPFLVGAQCVSELANSNHFVGLMDEVIITSRIFDPKKNWPMIEQIKNLVDQCLLRFVGNQKIHNFAQGRRHKEIWDDGIQLTETAIYVTRNNRQRVAYHDPKLLGETRRFDAKRRSVISTNSFGFRRSPLRERLIATNRVDPSIEKAISNGLDWLKRNQVSKKSTSRQSHWSLRAPYKDGTRVENHFAATGLAMLAFLGAGNTHQEGDHRNILYPSLQWLTANAKGGTWPIRNKSHSLYGHAICTISLCELYGMTNDSRVKSLAQSAIDHAINSQLHDGGWGYHAKGSDTSVTGWFAMALHTGKEARLKVPDSAFKGIHRYLESVANQNGSYYKYRTDSRNHGRSTTAVGLLCRQYEGWERNDARLTQGVRYLTEEPISWPRNRSNVYYWYYATRVMRNMGGRHWATWMQKLIPEIVSQQVRDGKEKGSWFRPGDQHHVHGGRLYTTCMCLYILQSYYRHLPLYDMRK